MKYFLVALISVYQKLLSPWLPDSCRFTPTCSQYAKEAMLKYGLLRGLGLSLKRLSKCHPFHAGGYDPVP
jgi:putative membrane protein insertion efficiency factor